MSGTSSDPQPALTFHRQLNATYNHSWSWSRSRSDPAAADGAPPLPTFSAAAGVRVALTWTLCVLSAFCNLAVLRATRGGARRKSHIRMLMANLASADLLVTFIVMPVDGVWNVTVQWLAGDLACRALMFLKLQAMYACAFVTVVISLDRQAAILHPLAINKAGRRNKAMLAVAWLMSVVLSIPQIFIFHSVTISRPEDFTQCTTRGSFPTRWHETAYNMFTFSCLFLLPLVVMVTCYTRIFLEISRRVKNDDSSSNQVRLRRSRNVIPRARMRTLKMSVVIVASFILCWTPYYLLGLWYWFFPEDLEGRVSHALSHMLFLFGLLNACLDPLIYGLFTAHVRKGLRRLAAGGAEAAEPDDNTVLTGSLAPATSAPSPRGEVSPVSQDGAVEGGDKRSAVAPRPSFQDHPHTRQQHPPRAQRLRCC